MASGRVALTIVVAVVAAALVAVPVEAQWHGLAVAGATALGSAWVFIGVRRLALAPLPARLLVAATAINLVFRLAWAVPNQGLGQSPAIDAGLVVADLLLAATLIAALTLRERPRDVLLDMASIAAGAGLVVCVLLAGSALDGAEGDTPLGVSSIAFVVADVALLATVLRVLFAPRGRPRALWLLAAGATALAATGVLGNEALGFGGSAAWIDLGWGVAPLLLGLAALDPSLQRLASPDRTRCELRITSAVVLGVGSLLSPLLLLGHSLSPAFPDIDDSLSRSLMVAAGSCVVASLVVTRFVLLLRRAREFAQDADVQLRERSRALERSETRYRQLVEQVPAVLVVYKLGAARPIPVFVSPQSETLLGVRADDWVAGPSGEGARAHFDDLLQLGSQLERAETTTNRPEFRILRPDGREVWVRDVSGVITEEADGRYLHAMLVDITDAKQAEIQRERMENELRLSHKLEAVGQLASGIAHEINTPIQFVGDTLRFLQDAFDDLLALCTAQRELRECAERGEVTPELVERIRDAEEQADLEYLVERAPAAFERGADGISRVATIVRAMRDFAHPPTTEKTPVDLVSALHDALIVAGNAYRYVADVETDFEELPDVICNGGEIAQVFLNLVVNAAHAIEAVVGDSGERGRITLRARRDGDHVRVSVADTGCGITADVAERVFDPFFTTKEVGRGTGQGLALARTMVVERHDGTLTFTTEPGAGTTFDVRLPVGDAQPQAWLEAA